MVTGISPTCSSLLDHEQKNIEKIMYVILIVIVILYYEFRVAEYIVVRMFS